MGYETYTGIVAREVDTGEADRYLTILSAERGKLECYARGIRKQNSKLASQAGLMSFGEFQIYKKGERRLLTSAKCVESFYNIRTDVVKCAYAVHFLEVARDVIVEAQDFPEALQTLLNSLHVLCYRDLAPEFVARVFEIRILSLAGFAPVLDRCSVCGKPPDDKQPADKPYENGLPADKNPESCQPEDGETAGYYFAPYGEGLVCNCPECKSAAGKLTRISSGTLRAMKYVVECAAGDIFNFRISDAVSAGLAELIPVYLQRQLGREYNKHVEAERYRAFEREMSVRPGNPRAAEHWHTG